LLAVAAARRGWLELKAKTAEVTAWRFAACIALPSLLVLSFAATARGIYAAPSLIGFALAIALWAERALTSPDPFDIKMLRVSSFMIAAFAVVLVLAAPLAEIFLQHTDRNVGELLAGMLLLSIAAIWCVSSVGKALARSDTGRAIAVLFTSYSVAFLGIAVAYFPALNVEQDLTPIASTLEEDLNGRSLTLLAPDETTIAVIDMAGFTPRSVEESELSSIAPDAFGDGDCVLALTQMTEGPLSSFLKPYGLRSRARRGSIDLDAFAKSHRLIVEREYTIPDGRRYVLLSRRPANGP
jgi:hypothetical protein